METVKLFFGPLESLVSNPLPKYKQIEIKEETQEPEEEGERSENKKFIFKENFAVFSLENVDPSNFWKKNSTVERAEDDFWDFVFSDDWSNFSTLRLTSGSVLKDLFVHLEDLTNEGCIESETITHFDDHLSFSQGRLSGDDVKARIQMRIYKWPELKLKICIEGNEIPPVKESLSDQEASESNVSKNTAKKADSKDQEINKLLQNFSLSLIYRSTDIEEANEPLVKDSEFDEFYFPKSFSNSTSRTRHASLNSYLKMRLLLKKSKHWTERSEEHVPVHFMESKDDSDKSNFATKISAENKKLDKTKKKENKISKISAPISEQSTDVNESKSIEEEIEKILTRKPLWMTFEKKMDDVLNEDQLAKEDHDDDDSSVSRISKNKQKKEIKPAKRKKESIISKASDEEILTKLPPKARVVAKVSYADERIPVCVTKEMKRCPDTIVLRETCRSETLWSLPTPARIKCGKSKLHFFPWRSVCPLECQRFKEELRSNLPDDLTELWNLGQDDESSSSGDGKVEEEEKESQVCFKHFNPCLSRREDRHSSCRSIIKREINKIKNRKQINKAPPGDSSENVEEVQSSSSFVVGAMGFVREKSGEYLLAAMRRYQVRKETISFSISNKVESVTCLTFNRSWRNNFAFCCKQCINE